MDDPKTTYSFNDLFEVDSVKNTEARRQHAVKDNNSYYKVNDEVKDLCFIEAKSKEELGSPVSATIYPASERGEAFGIVYFSKNKTHRYETFDSDASSSSLFKKIDCPPSEEATTPAVSAGGRKRKSRKYKRRSNKRKSRRNKTKKRKGRR